MKNSCLMIMLVVFGFTGCARVPWLGQDMGGDSTVMGDGSTIILSAVQDTNIDTIQPSTNFGLCDDLTVNQGGASALGDRRVLLMFDLASIPAGATVENAELRLTKLSGTTAAKNFNIHRVTNGWDEGFGGCSGPVDEANWTGRTSVASWDVPGGDYDPGPVASAGVTGDKQYTWASGALTTLVDSWHKGTIPNYGLILGSPEIGAEDRRFASRENSLIATRPQLVVSYTFR